MRYALLITTYNRIISSNTDDTPSPKKHYRKLTTLEMNVEIMKLNSDGVQKYKVSLKFYYFPVVFYGDYLF
jgi:hypothetical protein